MRTQHGTHLRWSYGGQADLGMKHEVPTVTGDYRDPYDIGTPRQKALALRRRLVLIVIVGVLMTASAQRLVQPLVRGWYSSVEVLRLQEQIEQTREEIRLLDQQVAALDTTEGKDVEAKRQLILGPPGEIWIVVHPEKQPKEVDAPVGIGARTQRWLTDAGGRALDNMRFGLRVLTYWGLGDTDEELPGPLKADVQEAR